VSGPTRAQIRVKDSRFLALCEPCADRDRARSLIEEYERQHADATHVCWAWRLRSEPEPGEAWSDAGEPAGTAGVPIVGALRSAALENVLGIVVRWFGGTKLGRGGLIRAYREAMQAALEQAEIVTAVPQAVVRLQAPAALIGELHRVAAAFGADYREQRVEGEGVVITVSLPARLVDTLREQLAAATRGAGSVRSLETDRAAEPGQGEETDDE